LKVRNGSVRSVPLDWKVITSVGFVGCKVMPNGKISDEEAW